MNTFNSALFYHMLNAAIVAIRQQSVMLNELDGKTGDGDHGTTMLRVAKCIEANLTAPPQENWQQNVDAMGWEIMSQDGGSAGMLVGNLFIGIAEGLVAEQLSSLQTAAAFRLGATKLQQLSGAKLGDKTMLDALLPAILAMEQSAQDNDQIEALFMAAQQAAEAGAEATIAMLPSRGRAKNMGAKAIGFIDPGATSMALLFKAFSSAFNSK